MVERADIPAIRRAEYEGLLGLLLVNASLADTDACRVADRIARASLEPGHL